MLLRVAEHAEIDADGAWDEIAVRVAAASITLGGKIGRGEKQKIFNKGARTRDEKFFATEGIFLTRGQSNNEEAKQIGRAV